MSSPRWRLLAALVSCVSAVAQGSDAVLDWNSVTLQAIRTAATPPPRASRALAMVHAAIYDSVNAIGGSYAVYHVPAVAPAGASREAAAVEAAYTVLSQLYPAQVFSFDAARLNSLAAIPDGQSKTDGITLGQAVGNAILVWRSSDGSDTSVPYVPGTDPGDWRPTPPAFTPALLPQWPYVTPFAMISGSQFRASSHPTLDSSEYTAAFNEVKEHGSLVSTTRTPEQSQIAHFWADGAGTETPPGHWNAVAQSVAVQQGNSMYQNARLFALLNVTLADAAVSCWDTKYAYNLWRPITGIREADTDNNPDTAQDATWTPLLTTPPFPAYPSGHSTFSGSASRILALFYGDDNISFSTDSDALPGVTRSFSSFSQAADEAGQSRIYGGIHWQYDNQAGLAGGRQLGDYVFANVMLRLPASVGADFDRDGDVDLTDFARFQECFNGPNRLPAASTCESADLDYDDDVDLNDFAVLSGCFNGPNRSPACP